MVSISESEARRWYKTNGIMDKDWDGFIPIQKGMLGLEAIATEWNDVSSIRETGVPETAVLLYFNAEDVGLDENEVEGRSDLTSYVIQNTTSSHIKELFNSYNVEVLSVGHIVSDSGEVHLQLECEADESLFS